MRLFAILLYTFTINCVATGDEMWPVIYFQTIVYCGMRFLVVQISTLPCILNGVGIAVSVLSY